MEGPVPAVCTGTLRAENTASNLAKPAKIRISAPSADPGRELNGRSQQIIRDFDVAGPVGPSSRVSAF
jgi:hypothetical protein